jgi:hypothetical protein
LFEAFEQVIFVLKFIAIISTLFAVVWLKSMKFDVSMQAIKCVVVGDG